MLGGPHDPSPVPSDVYRRLASDIRSGTGDGRVVADLSGPPLDAVLDGGVHVLKVSHEDLIEDGRAAGDGIDELAAAAGELQRRGAANVVVSRGVEPTLLLAGDDAYEVAAPALEAADPTGAGDSMTAGIAAGLVEDLGIVDAVRFGAAAGALERHPPRQGHRRPQPGRAPGTARRGVPPAHEPGGAPVTPARRDGRRRATVAEQTRELDDCAEAAAGCTRCDLYRRATQTVFGEGRAGAKVLLVGEQPGDREDIEGHPFVGPAGSLLDAALESAGIGRRDVYVTNAVKHFKFEERGKRRIHKKPSTSEIQACHTWLEQEVRLVRPRVVVCLGATAARAVLGRAVTLHSVRDQILDGPDDLPVVVTIHPAAALRTPDSRSRAQLRARLVDDLELAAGIARSARGAGAATGTA